MTGRWLTLSCQYLLRRGRMGGLNTETLKASCISASDAARRAESKGTKQASLPTANIRAPLFQTPGQNNPAQCRSEAISLTFFITSHDPYAPVSSFPVDYTCIRGKKNKKKNRGGRDVHLILSLLPLSRFPTFLSLRRLSLLCLPTSFSLLKTLSARRSDSGARVIAGSLLNSHNALL